MRIERPNRDPDLVIRALGNPKPAGSKSSGVAHRKVAEGVYEPVRTAAGKLVTFTKDDSGAPGKAWRSVVADAGAAALDGGDLLAVPLYVEMTFLVRRATNHYGSGRNAAVLRNSAPSYPATRPDVLKLARAVEDALTNVVWVDDARIVSGPNEKDFAQSNEATGVEVRVWSLPATVSERESECQSVIVFQERTA